MESCPETCLENLPEELIQHILSFLSYEQIDKLRLVSHTFKDCCTRLLKLGYTNVRKELKSCYETSVRCRGVYTEILWYTVNETLSNSFCLYDVHKGYLAEEYSVSAKAIDIAKFILQFKNVRRPLLFLIEKLIGRGGENSNMRYFDDEIEAYVKWFTVKKYRNQPIKFIYLPIYPIPPLRRVHDSGEKWFYSMMLDILTTLFIEETNVDKHLVLPEKEDYRKILWKKFKYVCKPSENVDAPWSSDDESYGFGSDEFESDSDDEVVD